MVSVRTIAKTIMNGILATGVIGVAFTVSKHLGSRLKKNLGEDAVVSVGLYDDWQASQRIPDYHSQCRETKDHKIKDSPIHHFFINELAKNFHLTHIL